MIKKDSLFIILIYVLMFSAIIMPWYNNGKYNQDLLVLIVYINTIFENTTLLESFNENVFIIFFIRKIFLNISSETLIFITHNFSVLLLTFTLKKYLKPIYVCSILFFCFFTVFCNQFRLAIALSIALRGYMIYPYYPRKGFLYLTISLFLHFFVGTFVLGFFLIDLIYKAKKKIKIFVFSIVILVITLIYLYVMTNPRFLLYLQPDDSGFVSSTYVLIILSVIVLFKSIDKGNKTFVLIILFLVILSSPLSNISSRMGEMLYVIMPFLSIDAINKRWYLMKSGKNIHSINKYIYLSLGLMFFLYRFINWVILDKVIRPEILDNF